MTGNETEQFSVAGAFFGRLAFEAGDLVADEIPYFGQAKGAAELITGQNALGEDLGVIGRVGAALNTIPGGGIAKRILGAASSAATGAKKVLGALVGAGKKADNVVDGAGRMSKAVTKTAKAVDDVATATLRQLQKKYKHAGDFGITGNPNKANLRKFYDAIQKHLNNPATKQINGTFRGNSVIINVNPNTGLAVIREIDGSFVSGWKLTSDQLKHVLSTGKLGGG